MTVAVGIRTPEQSSTAIDISPYVMPGTGEEALDIGSRLAMLWRDEIIARTVEGPTLTAERLERGSLSYLQKQIIGLNREIRRHDLAREVEPSDVALNSLRLSTNYQRARADMLRSTDPDVHRNFRTYTLDRIAFLAAWHSLYLEHVQ